MRELNASDFKARCLALLDEVSRTGERIRILKRGKPVAQLVPIEPDEPPYPQERLKGSVHIHGDIVGPVLSPGDWEAEAGPVS